MTRDVGVCTENRDRAGGEARDVRDLLFLREVLLLVLSFLFLRKRRIKEFGSLRDSATVKEEAN